MVHIEIVVDDLIPDSRYVPPRDIRLSLTKFLREIFWMISNERSTAFVVLRSATNSSNDMFATNVCIASSSSRICKMYVLSLSIEDGQVAHDSRFHILADTIFSYDVDFSMENVFQTILQADQI